MNTLESLRGRRLHGIGDVFRYMSLARQQARKSDHMTPMGAVVTFRGQVLAVGRNWTEKTHPMANNFRHSVHAEIDCMIGMDREQLRGSVFWVYRQHKNGRLATARPCDDCYDHLKRYGVRWTVYTDTTAPFGITLEKIS